MLASYLPYHFVVAITFALIFIIVKGIKNIALYIQAIIEKFETELKNGARIITAWSPPDLMLPTKTEFPFFVCRKPFKYAKNIKEQIEAVYGNPCIDFTASWLLAEKYIDALEVVSAKYHRFVNIFQSMIIWINAWNMGVACEEEIPPPVQT